MEHEIYIELVKIQNQLIDLNEKNQYLYDALVKEGVIKEEKEEKKEEEPKK